MLHPDTAMHAIRILGVDLANMTTQNAVYQASVEELIELAIKVDPRSWEPLMEDDDAPSIIGIKLPVDQQAVLEQIVMLIHNLR